MKGQPYGACQTLTALASGRRPQRPIAAGSPRRTRDVFRTGNPGEASSVTDAHNWAFRVTQKRQPDHPQAAQNRRSARLLIILIYMDTLTPGDAGLGLFAAP